MVDLALPSGRLALLDEIRSRRSQWAVCRQELQDVDAELAEKSRRAIARSRSVLKRSAAVRPAVGVASDGTLPVLTRRDDLDAAQESVIRNLGAAEDEIDNTVRTMLQNIARAEGLTGQHESLIHEIEAHCAEARRQIRTLKTAANRLGAKQPAPGKLPKA